MAGLQVGTSNVALMRDMERLLHACQQSELGDAVAEAAVSVPHGVAISAYASGGGG
jgi:hypothetical protein